CRRISRNRLVICLAGVPGWRALPAGGGRRTNRSYAGGGSGEQSQTQRGHEMRKSISLAVVVAGAGGGFAEAGIEKEKPDHEYIGRHYLRDSSRNYTCREMPTIHEGGVTMFTTADGGHVMLNGAWSVERQPQKAIGQQK